MSAPMINVFVGSETGLLKGIDLAKGTWRNLNHVQTPDKSNEITCLCWDDDTEANLTVGLRNHHVAQFDISSQQLSEFTLLDQGGEGKLRSISRFNDSLITGYDNGLVYVQQDSESFQEISTGSHLHCLTRKDNILGTGGKESDLKLFDLNDLQSGKPYFHAKNVRNDWLNLRVPIWVTGINFLAENKIVTSTGHHQVRVYDPKVQRRPVLDMSFDDYPITAMSLCSDHQIIVGNTQGSMGLLDVRKGKLVHRFKGFAGGIRSIQCHESLPVVASCGLDRFLRIHDINSKQMLHKIYMKSRLNCLLMSKSDWTDNVGDDEIMVDKISGVLGGDEAENDDKDQNVDDEVWESMKVVKTRTKKRKGTADVEEVTKSEQTVGNEEPVTRKKSLRKKQKTNKQKNT